MEDVLLEKSGTALYTAVIELVPALRVVVVKVAAPATSVAVPRVALPFLKVTVPAGVTDEEETVAVNVTDCPTAEGLSDEVTEVEVGDFAITKGTLLVSVPPGVVTATEPLVAPVGTLVVISELEITVNAAAVPLKVTPVAPVRSVPRILTAAPTTPEVGSVFTNGARPIDTLKTVPE
jgi:hypothetical protein